MKENKEADGIVAFNACKAQEEWDIRFQFGVITEELEEGVVKVILFQNVIPPLRKYRGQRNAARYPVRCPCGICVGRREYERRCRCRKR